VICVKLLRSLILVAVASVLIFPQTPPEDTEKFDQSGRWIHGGSEPWSMNGPSYTPEQAKTFLQRWTVLKHAIEQTDNEWEGQYGGDGGETDVIALKWTTKSGFVMVHASLCMASVIELSYGKVSADARHVQLQSEFVPPSSTDMDKLFARSLRVPYVPVKWDGSHYLVPEPGLKIFFGRFSGRMTPGEVPEFTLYFHKVDDNWEHDSLNNVQVPTGYEKYLSKPIEATITKVGGTVIRRGFDSYLSTEKWQMIPVTINAGKAQGVKVGTEFHILSFNDDDDIKVRQVFQNYSTGFIVRPIDDGKEEFPVLVNQRAHPPSVGWKLTTFNSFVF
jgi:hypothetical protein